MNRHRTTLPDPAPRGRHRGRGAHGILAALTAAGLATAGLTVTAGTASAAPACDGAWHRTSGVIPASGTTRAVLPISATEVLSGGGDATSATLGRWKNGRLTVVRLRGMGYILELRGTWSDLYVHATGTDYLDHVFHFDGSRFTELRGLPDILGSYGFINAMEVRGGTVYAFGSRFTTVGALTQVVKWDGRAWSFVANNLADSAYSVPLTSAVSPSGEIYVAGEDVTAIPEYPIWRSPWLGKVVGGFPGVWGWEGAGGTLPPPHPSLDAHLAQTRRRWIRIACSGWRLGSDNPTSMSTAPLTSTPG
jgi:hypothetical protein